MRPMVVIQVCADHNSYLKFGPNQKKRGLDCQARQVLFVLGTTIIFNTLVFGTPLNQKRANFEHCDIANKHKSKHTHTQTPKDTMMNPVPRPCCIRLHYLQSANQMLVLFWAPSGKFNTIISIEFTHFFDSITRPPENKSINCVHTLHKFGNLGYRYKSHICNQFPTNRRVLKC